MADQPTAEIQRFRPNNGRIIGVIGLLLCAIVAVVLVVTESAQVAVPGVIGCALVAGLVWMAVLRPSVAATASELRLRTMFESLSIPLASIDTVVVRRYLQVRSGGRRYICPAISRPLRKTIRAEMKWSGQSGLQPGVSLDRLSEATGENLQTQLKSEQDLVYADFVEQRIAALAANDRARRGIGERSEEEYALGSRVVRRPAWLELGVLVGLAVALVVALVIGA
jgi:hypothetical protein